MDNYYSLKMPSAVYSGADVMTAVDSILGSGFQKVVLFTDQTILKLGLLERLQRAITKHGIELVVVSDLQPEPTVDQANEAVKKFRRENADLIIAVGGGSVMDIAKLCSVLNTDQYTIYDLLDTPEIAFKQTKTLMLPTTAGTGAEATPNSIVTVPEKGLKVGIVNPEMIADYVALDVELIRRLPKHIAASTGVDAMAHAIECYTSRRATPFSDMYALEALRLIFPNILPACCEEENMDAKSAMLLASFYAGVAITAAGTTAVHALAYPLGGRYHIAHGVSNAMLLAPVMRYNMPCCTQELTRIFDAVMPDAATPDSHKPEYVISKMESIIRTLEIPTDLSKFGVYRSDLEDLVTAGMQVTRLLNNNRRTVTKEDARALYQQIMPNN